MDYQVIKQQITLKIYVKKKWTSTKNPQGHIIFSKLSSVWDSELNSETQEKPEEKNRW